MTHRVFVRDAALSLVGQLTYLKLTLVLRFNALSTWTLDADEASLPVIPVGGGIVVVDDDDNVVLSGPATSFSETAADDTRSVTRSYAGVDDDIWLTRRLSFPDPAAAAIAQTAVDSDVRTGAAETVMRQFVTVNAGASWASRPRRAASAGARPRGN